MQFKTKDLLVSVITAEAANQVAKACLLNTHVCLNPTFCLAPSQPCLAPSQPCLMPSHACVGGCSFVLSCIPCSAMRSIPCPGGSIDCLCTRTWNPIVIEHAEDLVRLKAELASTMKAVEALEREKKLPSAITTKAEAEALERGLTEILQQVSAAKKAFKE